mmetsp:Transcript_96445/g.229667  ORF Transcript_96445/g.229667 Transcript_96445/m.229667 type:complete len:486 (-) Transcript_96445:1848-3305(-)
MALHHKRIPKIPPEKLVDVLALLLQCLSQQALAFLTRLYLCPHVHRIVLIQLRVLAHLLHLVDNVSRYRHELEVLILSEVEDDLSLIVSVDVQVRIVEILQLPSQLDVITRELVALHSDLSCLLEVSELGLAEVRDCVLDGFHVLAQPLPQCLEVQGPRQRDLCIGFVDDLHDVELLFDVLLKSFHVLHEALVLVHDGHGLQRHLQTHFPPFTARAAQLHHGLHAPHRLGDVLVDGAEIRLRNHHPVHGLRLQRMPVWKCSGQVLIYVLRDERNHWGKANRDVQQDLVEGTQRSERLLQAVATSHPVAVQPNIPVGQVFQEVHQLRHHRVEPICLHLLAHELDEAMHRCKDPLVHMVRACLDLSRLGRELLSTGALVAIALLDQEAIGVEHRQENILHDIPHALLLELQRFGPDHTRVQHVHPNRICTMVLGDVLRIRKVLEALGHLLAICGQHQAVDNQVLEGGAVEEVGSQHHKRVEPAPGLV